MAEAPSTALLRALSFAARKHRDQRRKGAGAPPFINHAIQVAELLAVVGGVTDIVTLQAAVLHDTLEDTDTRVELLIAEFGVEVARVVQEVTDDMSLPLTERNRQQVIRAPFLTERARLVRLADKIANVRAIGTTPPVGWSPARRRDYLEWTDRVIAGCRGSNAALERVYEEELREARRAVAAAQAALDRID